MRISQFHHIGYAWVAPVVTAAIFTSIQRPAEPLYFTRDGQPVRPGLTVYAGYEFYVDSSGDWWEPTSTGGWRCRWRRRTRELP
jgi:hypothetical protein